VKADVQRVHFRPAQSSILQGQLGQWRARNLEKRLLTLDLESILRPFTQRPGVQEWVGEHAGKWLHAASLYWENAHDARLRGRMDEVARALAAAQDGDGYLGTYLPEHRWTSWDVWSHKYNLIGLLAYHRATGDAAALEAARRMGDLLSRVFGEEGRDIIASGKHVGMAPTSVLEPMVALYRATGEGRYLDFCRRLVQAWSGPGGPRLIESLLDHGCVHRTANNKAYELMSCLVGLADLYEVTGEADHLRALLAAFRDIRDNQTYAIGSSSFAEHFPEPGQLIAGGFMAGDKFIAAAEGCVTVTWMQLCQRVYRITGDVSAADEVERTVYNALPAAQSPLDGKVCYFLPLLGRKRFGEVTHGIEPDICCCASSLPRGMALLPELAAGLWDGEPTLLLYEKAIHRLRVPDRAGKEVEVEMAVDTDFPETGRVRIHFSMPIGMEFSLRLRVPGWSRGFLARVPGGGEWRGEGGSFLEVRRLWRPGDSLEVRMELPVAAVKQGRAAERYSAVTRGPQVLGLDPAVAEGLPSGWVGRQRYPMRLKVAGEERVVALVPFAEMGQGRGDYEAVFADLEILESEVADETPEGRALRAYRAELEVFRNEFGGVRTLPPVEFFLFGMGHRKKLLFRDGRLVEVPGGRVVREWYGVRATLLPSESEVVLRGNGGVERIVEDHEAVWILGANGSRHAVEGTRSPVVLPDFAGHRYARILRVLHQELLVNIMPEGPVPNFFVYSKPWYRDAAMMALAFRETGNVDLLKDWVAGLREPYDRNNAGEIEADNLGQLFFLIALAGDRSHPLVPIVQEEVSRFTVESAEGPFIRGRSDFAECPVYQTKWLKFGLKELGLPDPYVVPKVQDVYAALFWVDYKKSYASYWDAKGGANYPYLDWAADHFHGRRAGLISNRDYPLTWEAEASQANYEGMRELDPVYADDRLAAPHTWHAAEIFLHLLGPGRFPDLRKAGE